MHDDLVVGRELHDPLEHRRVEAQRRARVDDREDRRLAVDRRLVDAAGDADHLEDVDVALAAEAVAVDRLVHQGQRVVARPQVADAVVEVDRLDRIARQEVDGVERLGQAQQVLVVDPVADPPAAIEVGDVGRAADGPEGDPVAAQLDVVRSGLRAWSVNCAGAVLISSLTISGSNRTRCESGVTAAPRPRAGPRARRRRGSPSRSRTGRAASRVWIDSSSSADRSSVGRIAHPRLGPRRLLRSGVAGMALATATPTTSEPLARGRVHVRHAVSRESRSAPPLRRGSPPTQL